MDLRQLVFFSTLADTLNFHRAAERLNMSQPPLSVAIRKLEREIGVTLFERLPGGVRLSAAGVAALPAARSAVAEAQRMRKAAREGELGETGALRLGFVGSSIFNLLPNLIPAFRNAFPRVDLAMVESTTHDMVPDLLDGRIDVALVRLPLIEPAALELTVIERDELVAAVPTESGHVQRGRIDLADLADEPFISLGPTSILRTTVLMACHEAGFVPRMTQEVPQLSTVLCLVQSGLGVALVPSNVKLNTPRGVRLLPLKRSPTIEIGLALAPGLATPAASNFKKLALSKLQDTSKAGGLVNPDKDQLPLKTGGRRSKKAATASS